FPSSKPVPLGDCTTRYSHRCVMVCAAGLERIPPALPYMTAPRRTPAMKITNDLTRLCILLLYARHTKIWIKRYGTGSGSDLVVSGTALSERTRSLPLPVPYQRECPSNPYLGVPLI